MYSNSMGRTLFIMWAFNNFNFTTLWSHYLNSWGIFHAFFNNSATNSKIIEHTPETRGRTENV